MLTFRDLFLPQFYEKIGCMVCMTFNSLERASVWQRYVTSLPLLSLPFSPSPPQEFYPHCLEQCVCVSLFTFTRIPRLLQVLVGKFLFYYPYFYTTIVLLQFMTILKALKLFKDGTMKIKILLLQTLIFRQQIVFISF